MPRSASQTGALCVFDRFAPSTLRSRAVPNHLPGRPTPSHSAGSLAKCRSPTRSRWLPRSDAYCRELERCRALGECEISARAIERFALTVNVATHGSLPTGHNARKTSIHEPNRVTLTDRAAARRHSVRKRGDRLADSVDRGRKVTSPLWPDSRHRSLTEKKLIGARDFGQSDRVTSPNGPASVDRQDHCRAR